MYIFEYFLKRGSTKNDATVSFNNTVAGLDQSWRELKEQAHGAIYDIGTWLAKTYKNCTKKATTHNLNTQVERVQQVEEIEMKEFKTNTKMDEFINDSQNDGWEKVAHDDCLLSDKELDMSEWNVVAPDDCPLPDKEIDMGEWEIVENEQPGTNMRIEGKAIFGLIGRFLG